MYENNYGGTPSPGTGPENGGYRPDSEYRINSDEIRNYNYKDAVCYPADNTPSVRRQSGYYYSEPPKPPKQKKERNRLTFGFAQMIAICLVCAILAGAAGGFIGIRTFSNEQPAPVIPTLSPTETTAKENAPATSNTPFASGLLNPGNLTGTEIYSLGCPQTVGIQSEITTSNFFGQPSKSAITGSGFIIRSDGYIITNYHVVETALQYKVSTNVILHNGDTYNATYVGGDPDNDVAILKIDAQDLPAVAIGDSDTIEVGETVYTIGNPLGEFIYTMTSGLVSALGREITVDSTSKPISMFQFDAAVNSGNSGGPVYNAKGEVIGIVTAKPASSGVEGLGFAIPINDAMSIANDIIEKGYVTGKPSLGISVQTVPDSIIEYYNLVKGAYVFAIDEHGAAARAGIKQGDIITRFGDVDILSMEDLSAAKDDYSAGDSVTVTVYRSEEYLEFTVTFDEARP